MSETLVAVSGDLFEVDGRAQLQVYLELVRNAWDMSLYSANKRKAKLKILIESRRPYTAQ